MRELKETPTQNNVPVRSQSRIRELGGNPASKKTVHEDAARGIPNSVVAEKTFSFIDEKSSLAGFWGLAETVPTVRIQIENKSFRIGVIYSLIPSSGGKNPKIFDPFERFFLKIDNFFNIGPLPCPRLSPIQ